jgi:Ca2+/Na+ antiporter
MTPGTVTQSLSVSVQTSILAAMPRNSVNQKVLGIACLFQEILGNCLFSMLLVYSLNCIFSSVKIKSTLHPSGHFLLICSKLKEKIDFCP